jgi:hypothetical protein
VGGLDETTNCIAYIMLGRCTKCGVEHYVATKP